MIDFQAKLQAVAEILEGRVVGTSEVGPAVNVKGSILGFPAFLQAISPSWPFGVTYIIETEVIEDPNSPGNEDALNLVIYPRLGQGFWGFFSHILLFEAHSMSVSDKRLESRFNFSHNNKDEAERFVKYPGVADRLLALEKYAKFSELTVKSDAGLVLSQPKSFNSLDLDCCRSTFRTLAEIGQVIFDAF